MNPQEEWEFMGPKERWDFLGPKLRSGEINFQEFNEALNKPYATHTGGNEDDSPASDSEARGAVTQIKEHREPNGHIGVGGWGGRSDGDRSPASYLEQQASEFYAEGGVSDTTHTDKRTGRSQKDRLRAYLRDGCWKSTIEIMRDVYGTEDKKGICRIPARIHDLKKEGLRFERRLRSRGVSEYRMILL